MSGQLHYPAVLLRERAPVSHWIGGWVGPRTGLAEYSSKNHYWNTPRGRGSKTPHVLNL